MKSGLPSLEDSASSSKQRRMVSYSTFRKWQTELNKESQTVTWPQREKTATGMVTALKCGICIRFQSAIERRRNYSDKWVVGAWTWICNYNYYPTVNTMCIIMWMSLMCKNNNCFVMKTGKTSANTWPLNSHQQPVKKHYVWPCVLAFWISYFWLWRSGSEACPVLLAKFHSTV